MKDTYIIGNLKVVGYTVGQQKKVSIQSGLNSGILDYVCYSTLLASSTGYLPELLVFLHF